MPYAYCQRSTTGDEYFYRTDTATCRSCREESPTETSIVFWEVDDE